MPRVSLLENLVTNLKERNDPSSRLYLSRQEAYRLLKFHTGQDFGDNTEQWEQWVHLHPESMHRQDLSKIQSPIMQWINLEVGDMKQGIDD